MSELRKEFEVLGFDLIPLETMVYDALDPGTSEDCGPKSCDGGCSGGCYTCKPGCSSGGK